jgi:hypothetical protein
MSWDRMARLVHTIVGWSNTDFDNVHDAIARNFPYEDESIIDSAIQFAEARLRTEAEEKTAQADALKAVIAQRKRPDEDDGPPGIGSRLTTISSIMDIAQSRSSAASNRAAG